MESARTFIARQGMVLVRGLGRPTHALPVDLFRVLIGLLSTAYFLHLYGQVGDYSGPDGLIDHALTRGLFWYTRLGLFQPWMGEGLFRSIYLAAVVASVAVAIGYRTGLATLLLFVVAVSAYRWNFLVIYVDDGFMHLALFWLLLLPIGRTLVLTEWLQEGSRVMERWKHELVPGGAMRCLLLNLALVDLIAGAWKLSSPMWRDGSALYAVLRMPISYAPDFWRAEHLPILRVGNYGAMALELLLPAMFVLPLNQRLKWLLLAGGVAFHVGIIVTLRIPYANLACIAGMVLAFRREIMTAVLGWKPAPLERAAPGMVWRDRAAVAFVGLLGLAMAGETQISAWRAPSRAEARPARPLPEARLALASAIDSRPTDEGHVGSMPSEHNPFYAPLWLIGVAQSYRLFDWIDERNFRVRYDALERRPDGTTLPMDAREVFPRSLRGVLLEAYLHDVTWVRIPRPRAAEFKDGLFKRFAQRYCRMHPGAGEVEVRSTVDRLTTGREAQNGRDPFLMFLMFGCRPDVTIVRYPLPAGTVAGVEVSSRPNASTRVLSGVQ